MTTPAALKYRMPAEWEPHAATWLAWPHRHKTFPGAFEPIPGVSAALIRTLAAFEPVNVLAGGAAMQQAREMVGEVPNVTLHDIETNDLWARDHGPIFLAGPDDQPPALVDWKFNAWGGKYPPFDKDDAVPRHIADRLGFRRFEPNIVLEGGSIDPNGAGTILTSEECLLHPNRNPHLSREDIERYLCEYLGARHIVWLGRGIVGDDTDGHIDELARFVNPTTVVTALEENMDDVNYLNLRDNFERLTRAVDQDGRPLDIIPLPMPRPLLHDGHRIPGSYVNFYIANGVVILPVFNDPADAIAANILGELFPTRQIIGLPALDLVWGRGGYHCITQQQPANWNISDEAV